MEISKELYENLFHLDYFSQCGNPINDLYNFEVYEENSYEKAVKSLSKTSWANITLEERNRLTVFLSKNHKNDYNRTWNVQAVKIREELLPPIIQKLQDKNICQEIIDDTSWLFMNILMHDYYFEFGHQSDLLNKVLMIWQSGHLPCGYSGKYPYGKLRVY